MKKIVILILTCAISNLALTEERDGFYLSAGLGPSFNSFEISIDGSASTSESYSGFGTSFKLGGYVSSDTALYYLREAVWFDIEGMSAISGIMGVGTTKYVESNGTTMYFEGGIGISDLVVDGFAEISKFGLMFGMGMEFTRNIQAGLFFLIAPTDDDFYTDVHYKTGVLGAKVEFKL